MRWLRLAPVAVLLVMVSCDRESQDSLAPSMSLTADSSANSTSTVCVAYSRQLADLKAQQAQWSGDAALQHRVSVISSVRDDACR